MGNRMGNPEHKVVGKIFPTTETSNDFGDLGERRGNPEFQLGKIFPNYETSNDSGDVFKSMGKKAGVSVFMVELIPPKKKVAPKVAPFAD